MSAPNGTFASPLRIVVGSDNAGHNYRLALKKLLESDERVSEVHDVGVVDARDPQAYPHIAVDAASMIRNGKVSFLVYLRSRLELSFLESWTHMLCFFSFFNQCFDHYLSLSLSLSICPPLVP